ncbi:MAG: LysR family transcriptional regulator [Lentilitoribacter sp.]
MDVSLKAMRYFMTAVECGSIAGASKELNVVPSAIFTAVNQVEDAFGLKLTLRHRSKGITPTATGLIVMKKLQHLLDEYETMMGEGADLRTKLTGSLRVGYYAPIAPAFVPVITSKLLKGNSGIDVKFIECDNHTAQSGLIDGTYDVIICVADAMHPKITYEPLTEVSAYLLAPEGHRLSTLKNVSAKHLKNENLVLLDLPVVSEYYGHLFETAGISPNVIATATSVEMVRSMVGQSIGCSILHMRPATDVSYAGQRVVALPFDPPLKPLQIALGFLSDNPRRLVSTFIEETRAYFAGDEVQKFLVASK